MSIPPKTPPDGPKSAAHEAQMLFQQAVAFYNGGRVAKAQSLCENALKKNPRHFDALHLLGVLAYQGKNYVKAAHLIGKAISLYSGNADFYSNRGLPLHELGHLDAAIASYDKAIALRPHYAEAYFNRGNALKDSKRLDEAQASYERAIALKPDFAEAHYSRGIALQGLEKLGAAIASYDLAIAINPGFVEAHYNRANALYRSGDPLGAAAGFNNAIALNPNFAEAYCNHGNALKELRRFDDALASYNKALALRPSMAEAHFNRGNVLQSLKQPEAAMTSYDTAIALKPDDHEAYFGRGVILQELERWSESLADYDRMIALNADRADVFHNRGLVLRQLQRSVEALESHARAVELDSGHIDSKKAAFWIHFSDLADVDRAMRLSTEALYMRGEKDRPTLIERRTISAFRLVHDFEQSSHLLACGHACDGLEEFNRCLGDILSRHVDCHDPLSGTIPLTEAAIININRFRKGLLRYQVPSTIRECLNPDNDWAAIEDQYFACTPEVVSIDNLLTEEALLALRQFCQISTVWRTEYKNQYLGAFAGEGFVSPLHFRIAQDLRQKMPRIFGEHRLEHLWAFKYAPKMETGINVHADFARVNLNFWVTPDEANLDPETGGLVVYDVPSPTSWSFDEYNHDEHAIYKFLESRQACKIRVPYKCNRAVLFNSNLFHETDELHFKAGYKNRRINVTYLFGRGLKTL